MAYHDCTFRVMGPDGKWNTYDYHGFREHLMDGQNLKHVAPSFVGSGSKKKTVKATGESMIDRMTRLKPTAKQGAILALDTLWDDAQKTGMTKAQFDKEILALAKASKVSLSKHGRPQQLSEEYRNKLVKDEFGNHYGAISIRTDQE